MKTVRVLSFMAPTFLYFVLLNKREREGNEAGQGRQRGDRKVIQADLKEQLSGALSIESKRREKWQGLQIPGHVTTWTKDRP